MKEYLYEKLKQEYYNHSMTKSKFISANKIWARPKRKTVSLGEYWNIFKLWFWYRWILIRMKFLLRSIPTMNLRDSYENIFREILDNISKIKM